MKRTNQFRNFKGTKTEGLGREVPQQRPQAEPHWRSGDKDPREKFHIDD